MIETESTEEVLRFATEIVVAFLSQRAVEPEELPGLVSSVCRALAEDWRQAPVVRTTAPPGPSHGSTAELDAPRPPAAQAPAVPVAQSVTHDHIVCLEDGRRYRTLRRHLMSEHGLTPEQYRAKWGLPSDYPMVPPSYSEERSEVAKRIGLGLPKRPAGRAGARTTKRTRS